MTELEQIICRELPPGGAMPFARFMELALYCPKIGYYERNQPVIGRSGDFYTSISVGPLFGELLALQFAQWVDTLASAGPLCIVEAGAHKGCLAGDILGWLRRCRPTLWPALAYWIIEPSPQRQAWQRAALEQFAGQVRWAADWHALPPAGIHGVIFSNELLDAFPVHRLGWDAAKQEWFEWGVIRRGAVFDWTRLETDAKRWPVELREAGFELPPGLLAVLPDGWTLELCPTAAQWWRHAALALKSGKLVTIDYGFTVEEWLVPERGSGTLRAFFQHHATREVLARPGEQDLTAHVNFTQLQRAGEAAGLKTEWLESQGRFLVRLAGGTDWARWDRAQIRQFQTLTHPEHLGRAFRVLVQAR